MSYRNVLFSVLAATAAFGLPSGAALAGTFAVSPVRLDLSGAAKTAALTIRNDADKEVVVQVDAQGWDQPNGEDTLSPTRDLLVTPAVFKLPPKASQLVRVALRRAPDAQKELSYRLVAQEVPQPASDDFTGLRMALRISLPVFVAPAAKAAPQLTWGASKDAAGQLVVTATNAGTAHTKVLGFTLTPDGSSAGTFTSSEIAYVLPGQSRRWTVTESDKKKESSTGPTSADARLFRLKGQTEEGEFAADVAVGP